MSGRLTPRPLGHTGLSAPPIIWRADEPIGWNDRLLQACRRAGANWFFLPSDLADDDLHRFVQLQAIADEAFHILLGVTSEELKPRDSPDVRRRLSLLRSCIGVILEDASPTELKAGRVFQRLSQLRDDGHIRLTALATEDMAAAQWIVQNTAAQVVCAPYGLADQTAAFALLPLAAEIHTAFIATRPPRAIWPLPPGMALESDVSFRIANERVTAQVESLPATTAELERMLEAVNQPMPAAEREEWWRRFAAHVPPPKKPRGNHPPEEVG